MESLQSVKDAAVAITYLEDVDTSGRMSKLCNAIISGDSSFIL